MSPQLPRPASISTRRVATLPWPGAVHTDVVLARRPLASIPVDRPYAAPPQPRTRRVTPATGPADAGSVTVAQRVVVKIARRAAAEHPDVGGVGTRLLGAAIPGVSRIGGSSASLQSLPGATAEVDGQAAFLGLELSVRYPAPLIETLATVRAAVRQRVGEMTGLEVPEIDITVAALVTDLPARPRVR